MSQRPAFGKLEEIQTKKCLLRSNNNVLPPTILELQSNNSGCQKYQTLYRINSINKRNDNNSFVTAPLSLFLEVGANNDKKSTVASSSLKVSKGNWLKSIFDIIFRTTGCEYASNQPTNIVFKMPEMKEPEIVVLVNTKQLQQLVKLQQDFGLQD